MSRNKIIINVTILAIVIIILIPTVYKIINKHNERLLLVTTKRIEEAAKDCYLDDICLDEKITLQELYNNNYLEQENNPITKEYYNELSYVLRQDNTYTFMEVK